ncbi:MAG: PQQ-dependent sugar dehydrogenase [Actinomycetota bacterium]
MRRLLVGFFVVVVGGLAIATAQGGAIPAEQAGFEATNVITGLSRPTNVEFAADGRVFIAEQGGLLKVFDSPTDTMPTIVADLRTATHAVDGRGFLGLALDPDFPTTPHVYVMYTHDAPIGGTAPTYGIADADFDECPSPPGPGECVVSGRISRLTLSGDVAITEQVILEDYCQEWTSHSVGDLRFGPEGALYATSGEGAFAGQPDWGQRSGNNGCGDPPIPHGGTSQDAATAEGGALRSQDLRTPGDPVGLSGTVIRIDKNTGAAWPTNPNAGDPDPNVARIIAYGLRNPYRTTFRPGTDELWIGDVGWNDWEEIDLVDDPDNAVPNFGWPCKEGPDLGYQIGNNLCNDLLSEGPSAVTDPYWAYRQTVGIINNTDGCLNNNGSPSALTFYEFGAYPAEYDGAFFFGDYSRRCVYAMEAGPDGRPDPSTVRIMLDSIAVTDLERGPNGDIYALNIFGGGGLGGTLVHLTFPEGEVVPVARMTATPTGGPLPLQVAFDASTSSPGSIGDTLTYDWDFDGDGTFGEASGQTPTHTYTAEGRYTAQVRVTDQNGGESTASEVIFAGDPPVVTITSPAAATSWVVDDVLTYGGSAVDGQGNPITGAGLVWDLILHHCETLTDCHTHDIGSTTGSGGSFVAPEHEYPSYIEVKLTATSASGLAASASVELLPDTVFLDLEGQPAGIEAGFNGQQVPTPSSHEVIIGSINTLSALPSQVIGGNKFDFAAWSNGQGQTHDLVVTESQSVTLQYAPSTDPVLYLSSTTGGNVDGIPFADEDVLSYDSGLGVWSMVFDGSDAGVGSSDVDAFHLVSLDPFEILVSFDAPRNIPGLGSIDDSDVLRFSGTGGPDTSGAWERVLDGSDVGFSTGGEDIDALGMLDGDRVLSTSGGFNVPGAGRGADEDLIRFTQTAEGSDTAGTASFLLDGSDLGLGSRDLFGVSIDPATGDVFGAALNTWTVAGTSGDNDNVFRYTGTLGTDPSGTAEIIFDGDAVGFANEQIDALHVSIAPPSLPGSADLVVAVDDDAIGGVAAGEPVTFTVDVTNNGPDAAADVSVDTVLGAGLSFVATNGCAGDPGGAPCELGTVGVGQTASFTVEAVVDAGAAAGPTTTSSAATSPVADPTPGDATDSVDTDVIVAPDAVDDGPAVGSAPGDPFHTDVDTALVVGDAAPDALDANDALGVPAAVIASFGGGDLGGTVTDNAAGANVTVGAMGSLTVDANGGFSFTPDGGTSGSFTFEYRLTNAAGSSDATVTILVGPRATVGDAVIYLSSLSGGNVDGIAFGDEDVLAFDTSTETWSMAFDGSDLGLGGSDIDGFAIVSMEPFVADLSLDAPRSIPGLGAVDDSDVLRFTGTGGPNTAGTLELLFDFSDIGLSNNGEDIDGLALFGGDHLLSSFHNVNASGFTAADEDIMRFAATSTGATTAGSLSMLMDGSDIGLGPRDVTGVWVDPSTGDVYGSALSSWVAGGAAGDTDDVFRLTGTFGQTTNAVGSIFFDGDQHGFGGEQIDAVHIEPLS